ncbi:hypothetical protein [Capnocytophaga canis]|uniref:hypothetical protein n=1 Tax=Capnocytophaga canis TaxID=1848903 RepID=UPI001562D1C3|nr:hypothetical protein [Capnocytophaga canis]
MKRTATKTDNLKERFLKHFEKCLGVISTACKQTKITRQTYYNWINSDDEFKEQVNDIQEEQKDYVESKLIENIEKNDTTAIIFYLKTKAKDRGYTDKTEVEVSTNPQNMFLDLMKQATSTD